MKRTLQIFRKEIKDTLRDRRTILMMVVMPLVVVPLLITVVVKVQQSQMEKADMIQETISREDQIVIDLSDNEFPLQTYGICIDSEGRILVPDLHVTPNDIKSVTAIDWKGNKSEADLVAIGKGYDSAIFKLAKPSGDLKPLTFVKFEPFELGTSFFLTYVDRVDQSPHINVSPYIVTDAPLVKEKDWKLLDQIRRGAVIGNAKGEPVGISMDQFLWTKEGGRDSFLGNNVKSDKRISFRDQGRVHFDGVVEHDPPRA